MASPMTPVGGTAADAAVGRLVVEIQARLDELVEGIVARIRDELPTSAGCPPRPSRVRYVGRALAAVAELHPPTGAELEGSAAVGGERAEQGLSTDGVLHAYRISISARRPRSASQRPRWTGAPTRCAAAASRNSSSVPSCATARGTAS